MSDLPTLDGVKLSYEYFLQNDVCRLCWSTNASVGIFLEKSEGVKLFEQIYDCLDLNITPGSCPKNICSSCLTRIDKFYTFKKFCHESNRKLKRITEEYFASQNSARKVVIENDVEPTFVENFDSPSGSDDEKYSETEKKLLSDTDDTKYSVSEKKPSTEILTKEMLVENECKANLLFCNISKKHFAGVQTLQTHYLEAHNILNNDPVTDVAFVNCHQSIKSEEEWVNSDDSCNAYDIGNQSATDNHNASSNSRIKLTVTRKGRSVPEYCIRCCEEFEDIQCLFKHNKDFHNFDHKEIYYQCYGCEEKFAGRKSRTAHELCCQALKFGLECFMCKKLLKNRKSFKDHFIKRHKAVTDKPGRGKYKHKTTECCIQCSLMFNDIKELFEHNKNVHKSNENEPSYKCYGCTKIFADRRKRLAHEHWCNTLHHGYKCYLCDRFQRNRRELRFHLDHDHISQNESFECYVCKKRFLTKKDVDKHRRRKHPQLGTVSIKELHQTHPKEMNKLENSIQKTQESNSIKSENSNKLSINHRETHGFKENEVLGYSNAEDDLPLNNFNAGNVASKSSNACDVENKSLFGSYSVEKQVSSTRNNQGNYNPEYCVKCRSEFDDIHKLSEHNKNVHNIAEKEINFKCYGCKKKFASKKQRLSHENICRTTAHGFKCYMCKGLLRTRRKLKIHMREHKERPNKPEPQNHRQTAPNKQEESKHRIPEYCIECRLEFEDIHKLSEHNKNVHNVAENGTYFKCYGCEKKFATKKQRLSHENICTSTEHGYQCFMCEQLLSTRVKLKLHMKEHKGIHYIPEKGNYRRKTAECCIICHIMFNDIYELFEHNKNVHKVSDDNPLYKCYGCGKNFMKRQRRFTHESICKALNQGYKCYLCNQFLQSRRILRVHLNHTSHETQTVKKVMFVCRKCNESFDSKAELDAHLSEKHRVQHVCEVCGRAFMKLAYLHAHMFTHSGVKLFQCSECDYSTGLRGALVSHIRTHTGERPFACGICPLRFSTQANMVKHRNRHLGVNPTYQCPYCEVKSEEKAHMAEHIAIVHKGRPKKYICQHCNMAYAWRRGLTRHLRVKHGITHGKPGRPRGPINCQMSTE